MNESIKLILECEVMLYNLLNEHISDSYTKSIEKEEGEVRGVEYETTIKGKSDDVI